MLRILILLILMTPTHSTLLAQITGKPYYPFASKQEIFPGRRIQFINDSTVTLTTKGLHSRPPIRSTRTCLISDSIVTLFPDSTDLYRESTAGIFPPKLHTDTIILRKIKEGFIDEIHSVIYVEEKYLPRRLKLIVILDGKRYTRKLAESNSYGILRKNPGHNRRLNKKINQMNPESYTTEFLMGLDAYRRFGIKAVNGVLIINSKQIKPAS